MAAIITSKFRFLQANQFRQTFDVANPSHVYLGVSKPSLWSNELIPDTPKDSSSSDIADLREWMAAKRINLADTSLCIPRVNWTTATVYDAYDDAYDDLFVKNFYVLTDELKLYKCVSKPTAGTASTAKPTATPSSGLVSTGDGYKWKYMLTVPATDATRFLTDLWIPIRDLATDDSSGSNQWLVQSNVTAGSIDYAVVTAGGTGYSSIPAVQVVGDGTGATATATINAGAVTGVTISGGSGYTFATLVITGGGGANATARAVLSPSSGHGSQASTELGAFYVMANVTLAYDESGKFPKFNDYRKIFLILNPTLYGTSTIATDPVYNCVSKLTMSSITGAFVADEIVTGVTSGAKAIVVETTGNILSIVGVSGTFQVAENIAGSTSGSTGNSITTKTNSELDHGKGSIIYKDYRRYVGRDPSQAENIVIVTEF